MSYGQVFDQDSNVIPDLVAAARLVSPAVLRAREQAEELRQVPPSLAEVISKAGLYQMFLPRSAGGPETSPLVAFHAIEELSKADGSVGWCVMIATDISLFTGWLKPEVAREICGQPASLRAAGSLRPLGRAQRVDGGYRVKGQWNFASGIHNADWLYCPCVLMNGDKPLLTAAGQAAVRAMWLPASAAAIKDTWSVMGLRGTGSQDFLIDDVFVAQDYTCFLGDRPYENGPLFRPRMLFTFLFTLNAAHALGIARGAMDSFVDMASRDTSTQSTALLRDRPLVQSRVAEAEAILNAARAYVMDTVTRAWEAACRDDADPAQDIAQARLAITHSVHEAARAVNLLFHAAGTNAIYTRNPLERHFRDIHVAEQHNAAFPAHFERWKGSAWVASR
jgi:alkylation response protein AidB-like acyl-CoA dehydrogenase